MQRLLAGVHHFQNSEFGQHRELFERLSLEGQAPHTLFITCADSRVLAELITASQPGDLFVVKNIGNIVPRQDDARAMSTAAAIEFAAGVLDVADVVVCGHSQCGAIQLLLNGLGGAAEYPHLSRWVEVAAPVRDTMARAYSHLDDEARLRAAEEENVLFAIENLRTYPVVQRRLADGTLHLHAWHFTIATGELSAYDAEAGQFLPLVVDGDG
jgi:carbonic anhydrase